MNTNTIINLDAIISRLEDRIRILEHRIDISKLESFADDTAALTGGLKTGDFYVVTSTELIKQILS